MILVVADESGSEELRRLVHRLAEIHHGDTTVCTLVGTPSERVLDLKKAAVPLLALSDLSIPALLPKLARRSRKKRRQRA